MERQLNREQYYEWLPNDTSHSHQNTINCVIRSFKKQKLSTQKVLNTLETNIPRTPKFFVLPKTHKKGNQDRPAISFDNSLCIIGIFPSTFSHRRF